MHEVHLIVHILDSTHILLVRIYPLEHWEHDVNRSGLHIKQPKEHGAHPVDVNVYPCRHNEHDIVLKPLVVVRSWVAQLSSGDTLKVLLTLLTITHVLLLETNTYPCTQDKHDEVLVVLQVSQGNTHLEHVDDEVKVLPEKQVRQTDELVDEHVAH